MTELATREKAAYQRYVKSVEEAKKSLDWTLSSLQSLQFSTNEKALDFWGMR